MPTSAVSPAVPTAVSPAVQPAAQAAVQAAAESTARSAAQSAAQPALPARRESPAERLDRNWSELLQEVRVLQTGIQILSGFLLTVPFQQRFSHLDRGQRGTFLVVLVLAALTTGVLLAPVSWHRMLFQQGQKAILVRLANRMTRVGLVGVVAVLSGALGLVTDVVAGLTTALVIGFVAAALLGIGWFLSPWLALRAAQRARMPAQPDR